MKGFIVHSWSDQRLSRIYLVGRLFDGRSFACVETRWRQRLWIPKADLPRLPEGLERHLLLEERENPREEESFSGVPLAPLRARDFASFKALASSLRDVSFDVHGAERKPAAAFLLEKGIRGSVEINGLESPARKVDVLFLNPELTPSAEASDTGLRPQLTHLSFDLETDEQSRSIRSISWDTGTTGGVLLRRPDREEIARADSPSSWEGFPGPEDGAIQVVEDETALLKAFCQEFLKADPDILTGWNILDFDLPRLDERARACGVPLNLGRTGETARYLEGSDGRSGAFLLQGRQVLDALRVVRASPERFEDLSLEAVSFQLLGEGKEVKVLGRAKLEELDRLWWEEPRRFASYSWKDSQLVTAILEKTGLLNLTVSRAALTGVGIDMAWTSIASFERIYGAELLKRGVVEPAPDPKRRVSGAAGGTILSPLSGLWRNVAVFDFRSLYPTIMKTFNIDPLGFERAAGRAASDLLMAPNGARFTREPGILPQLIGEYFEERAKALAAGDSTAAYVYKILMNSFYGVLGAGGCRYGRTELAGAITSFAKKYLNFARDWFEARNYKILYGDTDSVFVLTKSSDASDWKDLEFWGQTLAKDLNADLAASIRADYGVESTLSLRWEKAYKRFCIPRLRLDASGPEDAEKKGRAKGYAGLLFHEKGEEEVEIRGMEAVRSDWTPFARRFQRDLLSLIFHDSPADEVAAWLRVKEEELRSGKWNSELVYKRRLRNTPESYVHGVPPHVRAALLAGMKGQRGTIRYVWSLAGPEPETAVTAPLDYDHYLEHQVLPIARSLGQLAGFEADRILGRSGQLDLF